MRDRLMKLAAALPSFGVGSFERLERGMVVTVSGRTDSGLAATLRELASDLLTACPAR
jgi:hypothetical protein